MVTLKLANAAPIFNTENPVVFFTNVASRLLSSEVNLDLTRIQIYPTNQYTPAVHRLLQVAANVFDATSTNFYPSVFRPTFWVTNENGYTNVYINGYQQVVLNNSYNPITSDPQLALPLDVTSLLPGVNYNLYGINVYGVPWIIGAKKGFPNFNKFAMQERRANRAQTANRALDDPHLVPIRTSFTPIKCLSSVSATRLA